ncbi:MAG: Lrp/AsnC family transcriptional regulator [Methanoculleaceae archaeon]
MDAIDRYIVTRLEGDGRVPYQQLAKELGMTGVAVKKRIQKLMESGTIHVGAQVNTHVLGYFLNLILMEVDNEKHMREIVRVFGRCPRVVCMFTGLGGYNLIALTLAEDRHTLESELMSSCSLRSREGIRKSEVIQLERKLPSPFLPVRFSLATRKGEIAPCGVHCGSCERYRNELCLGCPATEFYRGSM